MFRALIIFVLVLPLDVLAQGGSASLDKDRAELLAIQEKYERAVSENKPDLILPYLDDGFQGETLMMPFTSKDDFKSAWQRARQDIGRGKGVRDYKLRIIPDRLDISKGKATAEGVTEETIETLVGPVRFQSRWRANLEKKGCCWKLTGMNSTLDPALSISSNLNLMLKQVVSPLPRLKLKNPRKDVPDYDGDGQAL